MNFKEWLKPQPLGWKQTVSTTFFMYSCILVGIVIGILAGPQILHTLLPQNESVSISVPDMATPTMGEVRSTLDEMPEEDYRYGYNCIDFARAAKSALRWQGQPSVVVGIDFETGPGHAVLKVPTTDEGWVFMDTETGVIVWPVEGGTYNGQLITEMSVEVIHWVPYSLWQQNPVFVVIE